MSKPIGRDEATRGYRAEIRQEEDGSWTLTVPSLPGLVAVGDTFDDAWRDLPEVVDLWLEAAHEAGQDVPPPDLERDTQAFSGKLMLRMPRSLHAELSQLAKAEGSSINMLCVTALTDAVARRAATGAVLRPRVAVERSFTMFEAHDFESEVFNIVPIKQAREPNPPKVVTRVLAINDKVRHAN